MKERPHYTYQRDWWCNDCGEFVYFEPSAQSHSCPKCGGSNIVLRAWKGFPRPKQAGRPLDPYDSRSTAEKDFNSGFDKAFTYSGAHLKKTSWR